MSLSRNSAVGVAAGLLLGLWGVTTQAQVTYNWIGVAGGATNWNVNASWSNAVAPGYPVAGDTANFTGTVAKTVNLNGNQAAATVNVSDSAAWIFNPAANTTTVSTAFNYGDTATSTFNSALSGTMALNVTAGRLLLSNNGNSNFNGGIFIKGGTLVAALQAPGGTMFTLGDTNQTITIGDSSGGADAALELYGNNTADIYANPIVIASGSTGKASIIGSVYNSGDNDTGIVLNRGITLNKDLTIFNNTQRAQGYCNRRVFAITGAIGGTGNIVKDGVGIVQFYGSNSYAGTTTVKNGWLNLGSGTHTFTGAIRVEGGMLIINTDARLGNANNTITLGSSGRCGILRVDTAALTTSRAVTIAGNGGILGNYSQNSTFNGPIGGAGRLAVDVGGYNVYLYGTNSYSGGTKVYMGRVFARNGASATALGTGNAVVDDYGLLTISGTNSVNASASVLVNGSGTFSIPADITAVPTIATNSSGRLGLFGTSGAAVNTRLASPLGNGYMSIASARNSNDTDVGFTFTGTNLAIGADNTYRFAPGYNLALNTPTTTGVLVDIGATPANVLCTGVGNFRSYDAQAFTGVLTVQGSGGYSAYNAYALTSGSTMGGSGPISLVKGALNFYGNAVSGAAPITKGALTNEATSVVYLAQDGGSGISLTVSSLTRTNGGCLQIWGSSTTNLGTGEKFIVTAAPVSAGGMVAPHMTIHSAATAGNQDFANYAGTNGFTNVVYTTNGVAGTVGSQAQFDATIAADIVKIVGADVNLSGPKTLYALKTNMQITNGSPQTLTLTSGGLILTGAGKTNNVNLTTTGELVVTVGGTLTGNATRNTLSGTLTAAGLTKTGPGTLILTNADNTATLTGDITVDQGSLEISNDNQLGATANRIVLNNYYGGWTDGLRLGPMTLPATRTILLGANGGVVYGYSGSQTIAGKITGSGFLFFWGGAYTITNPDNDYTGGTACKASVTLNGGQLGTGPVTYQNGGTIADNIYHPNRFILGSDVAGSAISFTSLAPQVGSLEGGMQAADAGHQCVFLNTANSILTLGGNNESTDLFAAIMDNDNANGTYGNSGIVKTGTGTFTMWGLNTYHGATVVTNGTLMVNNLIHPGSVVMAYAGATLDGIGTVGIVSNLGGTVQGNLYMNRLVMNTASTFKVTLSGTNVVSQYGQLNVSESIVLAGTLALTLNFAPVPGQTFTILNNTSGSPITGQFACGRKVSGTFDGKTYWLTVNYNGGSGNNDIVLTCIPAGSVFTVR